MWWKQTNFFNRKRGSIRLKIHKTWVITAEPPYHVQVWEYPHWALNWVWRWQLFTIEIAPIIVHQDLMYNTNFHLIKTNLQFSVKCRFNFLTYLSSYTHWLFNLKSCFWWTYICLQLRKKAITGSYILVHLLSGPPLVLCRNVDFTCQ